MRLWQFPIGWGAERQVDIPAFVTVDDSVVDVSNQLSARGLDANRLAVIKEIMQ
jgi:hypothetical protein